MPIPNSDEMRDPFPGITWGGPSAPGTAGATGAPADDATATVTGPTGAWQSSARYSGSAGTVTPDQNAPSVLVPGPQSGLTETGAGRGNPNPYRHPAGER